VEASRKRTVLALAGAVVSLVALLAVRALLFRSQQLEVEPLALPPIDLASAGLHLSQALRFPTVSHEDAAENDPAAFSMLQSYLREAYPRIDAELERRTVDGGSLLYTWRGEESDLAPVVLMAHQDVVPVEPGTEDSWRHPPFAGVVEGGFIWGRGAMDDKGALISLMEAVEHLLSEGFKPKRTIHLAFGHDEEVGGGGAAAVAALVQEEGARPYFVLDEGGAIVEGMLPGLAPPLATVGIAEKGAATVALTVEVEGGHSSMPPRHTAIGILSRALARLEENPIEGGIQGPFREMLETVGREMAFPRRLVLANLWLFSPLVERRFAEMPAADTMMRTSTAVTIVEGGVKANVLPSKARAVVNFRIAPGDSVAGVLDHLRRMVDDPRVQVHEPSEAREPSPVAPTDSQGFRLVERTIRQLFPDAIVAPYLLPGGTDSRHYAEFVSEVYRFAAMRVATDDLPRAHGTDERLSIDALGEMIAFYVQLLRAVQD
jgi:carboxypeptidase PM20D1